MADRAMIFDVDGTLIDTNNAHVRAWMKTLADHRYQVSIDRIEVEMGKGGDKLIPSIFGEEADKKDGDSLRKGHTEEYKKIAAAEKLRVFAGVENLLQELKRRGVKTALATSSKPDELDATSKSAGLDLTSLVDVVATGADSKESKPEPGILNAAVKKLKLAPTQCVMVGDTPFDVDASRDGGVVCFGFTCGGMNNEAKLRQSGARAVFFDPANLLFRIDDALRIAFPGTANLNAELNESLMREALVTAREGMEAGEAPIGAVLARGDGTVIARAYNELNRTGGKTAHAEMIAFARAAGKVSPDARDLILVSTLEPCVMCLGAAMEAAVDTIIYGMEAPADGGRLRVRPPVSPESQVPRIHGGILVNESRGLFKEFLSQKDLSPQQKAFAEQLIKIT